MVKMLTVLIRTISNSQVFLLKKWEYFLYIQNLLTFLLSKNISVYAILNDKCFSNTLTRVIVSLNSCGLSYKICFSV